MLHRKQIKFSFGVKKNVVVMDQIDFWHEDTIVIDFDDLWQQFILSVSPLTVAVTSELNLAWYFYQEKEQNLKSTSQFKQLFSTFPFHINCISLSYVSSSPLFSDIVIALVVFSSICIWAYWQIVTCDVFAVLQDYRWLLPSTASPLPSLQDICLACWMDYFLDSEHHKKIYITCFLCIPQSRTFLLLMTPQTMSWTRVKQRSSCKLLTTWKYMYFIDDI